MPAKSEILNMLRQQEIAIDSLVDHEDIEIAQTIKRLNDKNLRALKRLKNAGLEVDHIIEQNDNINEKVNKFITEFGV